jgi:hypothetical protein
VRLIRRPGVLKTSVAHPAHDEVRPSRLAPAPKVAPREPARQAPRCAIAVSGDPAIDLGRSAISPQEFQKQSQIAVGSQCELCAYSPANTCRTNNLARSSNAAQPGPDSPSGTQAQPEFVRHRSQDPRPLYNHFMTENDPPYPTVTNAYPLYGTGFSPWSTLLDCVETNQRVGFDSLAAHNLAQPRGAPSSPSTTPRSLPSAHQ